MNDDDPAAAHLHFSYTKDAGIILGFGMMVARKSFTFSSSFHFSLQADWNELQMCSPNLYILSSFFRLLGNI